MDEIKQVYTLLEQLFPDEVPDCVRQIGGMTNSNYLICMKNGKYVVRIPGKGTADFINRQDEYNNSKQMELLGMTPALLWFDKNTGIKVTVFVENSRNFLQESHRGKERWVILKKVLTSLRKMHNQPVELCNRFYIWDELDRYESLARSKRIVCLPVFLSLRKKIEEWRWLTEVYGQELTICHNDLVPENLLYTPDRKLFLIDWEYAGMNDPVWDLASFLQEARLSEKARRTALEFYYDRAIPYQVENRIRIYEVLADLLWYLWSELMAVAGTDYLTYGRERLFRAARKITEIRFIL